MQETAGRLIPITGDSGPVITTSSRNMGFLRQPNCAALAVSGTITECEGK